MTEQGIRPGRSLQQVQLSLSRRSPELRRTFSLRLASDSGHTGGMETPEGARRERLPVSTCLARGFRVHRMRWNLPSKLHSASKQWAYILKSIMSDISMIGCQEAYTFRMKVRETAGVTAREATQPKKARPAVCDQHQLNVLTHTRRARPIL